MSDLWIYGSSFSKENYRKLIRKVVPKMRVTGLSRLVENYARKSCRAFPLEDKDMYIYTGQIGRGDAGESAARKKTRPFKRN